MLLLAFAVTLLVAVLLSERTERSVLSSAVLFLVAGIVLGPGLVGAVPLVPSDPLVSQLAELALFAVLFTDGMRIGLADLFSAWRLPGRALLVGMPLTLAGTAALAHFVAGLPWLEALLLGAALSPTDPVFAAAIVGREEVPQRLRRLLNVESGLNDGLALPVVVVLIAVVSRSEVEPTTLLAELLAGVAIGVAIPWVAIRLEASRFLSAHPDYEALSALAIGLLVFALARLTHANLFLAAFAAGVTIATAAPSVRIAFEETGELIAELLKLAALLVFGALISPTFLADISLSGYLFAALALLAVRPAALGIALARSGLGVKERAAASWFGPKGFASVVYGLLILDAGFARSDEIFHLVAVVVAASIVAHSSTDVLVARWLAEPGPSTAASSPAGDPRSR